MLRWIKRCGVTAVLVGAAGAAFVGFRVWQQLVDLNEDVSSQPEETEGETPESADEMTDGAAADLQEDKPHQPEESWGELWCRLYRSASTNSRESTRIEQEPDLHLEGPSNGPGTSNSGQIYLPPVPENLVVESLRPQSQK